MAHLSSIEPIPFAQNTSSHSAMIQAIDKMAETDMNDGRISCAAIHVIHHNEVVYSKNHGYANRENNIPLNDSHLFRMASMTKPVTGVCVMKQVEEGKLSLDDPVGKYIPAMMHMDVAELDENGNMIGSHPSPRPITIRDLLCHGSGFHYDFVKKDDFPPLKKDHTIADHIDRWAESYLNFDPGSTSEYSWLVAFDLLAYLVELTSDMTFAEFNQKTIFDPLEMTNSCFVPTEEEWSRVVQLYDYNEQDGFFPIDFGRGILTRGVPVSYQSGAGSLLSNAVDYARFAHMLCCDGISGGVRILKEETVKEMRTPQIIIPGRNNTLSWGLSMQVVLTDDGVRKPLFTGAFGWSGSYGTHFFCDPKLELSVVYCANMINAGGGQAPTARHIEKAVMENLPE